MDIKTYIIEIRQFKGIKTFSRICQYIMKIRNMTVPPLEYEKDQESLAVNRKRLSLSSMKDRTMLISMLTE